MEKYLKIPASNSLKIYGKQRGPLSKPLVILVHGLTDNMNDVLIYNAAAYFADHGLATFRFNLYGWQKDARKFARSSLKTHAADLDTVIAHFRRKGARRIYVIGHSYGGLTILLSKTKDFDKVVLWEPTYESPKGLKEVAKFKKCLNAYILDDQLKIIIGKAMVEESAKLGQQEDLIKDLSAPVEIIYGSKAIPRIKSGVKKYFQNANQPKKLKMIPGATHSFEEEGKQTQLFRETLSWLKQD